MAANLLLRFVLLYGVPPPALAAAAADITAALRDGALSPLPVHRFSLDQVTAAHDTLEAGAVGKVLIELR
jgi:NADPH2:quinone reductase